MFFISPSHGRLTLEQLIEDVERYVSQKPEQEYRLIIGTDSHTKDKTVFVTALVVHRVGKGARYYYRRMTNQRIDSLRQRIYYETTLSLQVAETICSSLIEKELLDRFHVEIHVDIGQVGPTRRMIREIVGMVVANGYEAHIKPEAYGASSVANKHSKF